VSKVFNVSIKINDEVVIEKIFGAENTKEEIMEKMSRYIQEEQLTKLGRVVMSIGVPVVSK